MRMASHSPFLINLMFCLLVMLSFAAHATIAGRPVPSSLSSSPSPSPSSSSSSLPVPVLVPVDKKLQQEREDENGGINLNIEGVSIGLLPGIGAGTGIIGDFDHSGPAAANGQYIPGNDDTFVPNPGYEVPNPFHPGSASTP